MRNIILLLLSCLAMMTSCAWGSSPLPHKFSNNMVFFGDSLTDLANKHETEQKLKDNPCVIVKPPVTNVDPVPGVPNAVYDKLWASMTVPASADSLAFTFGAVASSQGGNDYAVSGAETSGMIGQVNDYIKKMRSLHPNVPYNQLLKDPNKLYAVWGGSNDVFHLIEHVLLEHLDHPELIAPELKKKLPHVVGDGEENTIGLIKILANAGARNFLVLGLPDLADTPLVASPDMDWNTKVGLLHPFASTLTQVVAVWNSNLLDLLHGFVIAQKQGDHPRTINIYWFNPRPLMDKIAADPEGNGFKYGDKVIWCQPPDVVNVENPDDYMFFNMIHPTGALHAMLAKHIVQDSKLLK